MIFQTLKTKMISSIKKIALAVVVLTTVNNVNAQLTVNGALTPTFLVNNVLLGTGITASGITYTGDATARGEFNGTLSDIGFADGVLLTTGNISNAIGPNSSTSITTDFGTTSLDPQLTSIASGPVHDAAILEFDFVPTSDSLKFRYVFASEEYPEFVCSSFNDVFGFFISGPDPAGGSYVSQNIAIIPGTTLPVAINTVNPGIAGSASGGGSCTSLAYSSYYFDNSMPPGATVQYDGFTVPLTARAAVTCGQTYHIKIAIADVGDGAYDSGVFLEAGSFSSPGITIVPTISYGGANDSTLYEGCGSACIYFVRTSNLTNADTINVTIGGSATNGVDYNTGVPGVPLPNQLFFAAGQDSISYCINAVADGITEGLETITLSIIQPGVGLCAPITTNATIYLNEYAPLIVSVNDTSLCNLTGTANLFAIVSGGVPPYTYTWTGGLPPVFDPSIAVPVTTNYIVTVNDACTGSPDPTPAVTDTATVTVPVFYSIVHTISYGGANDSTLYEGCGSACIYFIRTSSDANADTVNLIIGGSATNGVDYNTGVSGVSLPNHLFFAAGQDSISYCINAVADGITEGLENITLSINQPGIGLCAPIVTNTTLYLNESAPLTVSVNDTTLCNLGGTANLYTTVSGGVLPYTYAWTGGLPSVPDQSIAVSVTTNYIVIVNDACNGSPDPTPAVTDTATVTVPVFAPLIVNAGNDQLVCPGDMLNLFAIISGGGNPYTYTWITISGTDTVNSRFSPSTSLIATGSGTYQISVQDKCLNTQSDQVTINVEPSCVLNIPNIITPDGHGPAVNEFFFIENLDRFPGSSLAVYNRWGNKIYESSDYKNDWSGSKSVDGVYYYILKVPVSGNVLAKAEDSPSYKAQSSDASKIFTGYFQITRLK